MEAAVLLFGLWSFEASSLAAVLEDSGPVV